MNENLKATLLTDGEILNIYPYSLEAFKKYGTKSKVTDFGIILGSCFNGKRINVDNKYGYDAKDVEAIYWTKTAHGNNISAVDYDGLDNSLHGSLRYGSCRPALLLSSLPEDFSNAISEKNDTVFEIEYGEYPQQVVNKKMGIFLEMLYKVNMLEKTGKDYTTDSRKHNEYDLSFGANAHEEYEYNGKRYIRVNVNSVCRDHEIIVLSNGKEYQNGDYAWVEVSPIKWILDKKAEMLISKSCLFSGVRYLKEENTYDGNFENTQIYEFLQTYFVKEIIPSYSLSYNDEITNMK